MCVCECKERKLRKKQRAARWQNDKNCFGGAQMYATIKVHRCVYSAKCMFKCVHVCACVHTYVCVYMSLCVCMCFLLNHRKQYPGAATINCFAASFVAAFLWQFPFAIFLAIFLTSCFSMGQIKLSVPTAAAFAYLPASASFSFMAIII